MKSAAGKFGMVILKISFRDLPNIRLGSSAIKDKKLLKKDYEVQLDRFLMRPTAKHLQAKAKFSVSASSSILNWIYSNELG